MNFLASGWITFLTSQIQKKIDTTKKKKNKKIRYEYFIHQTNKRRKHIFLDFMICFRRDTLKAESMFFLLITINIQCIFFTVFYIFSLWFINVLVHLLAINSFSAASGQSSIRLKWSRKTPSNNNKIMIIPYIKIKK